MALAKLPKLIDTAGARDTEALGRRVFEWVSAAQLLLASLRAGSISTDQALADLTAVVAGLDLSGDGDVVGPSSAIDGRLALFDGTTGKLIKVGAAPPTGTNTGDQTITLTGDVTGSGTGSFAATVARVPLGATITGGTQGRVLFEGAALALDDDAGLSWDDTLKLLTLLNTANNEDGGLRVSNTTNASDAAAYVTVSAADSSGFLAAFPSGYTDIPAYADRVVVGTNSTASGLSCRVFATSQDFRWIVGFGSATELMRLDGAGKIGLGTTPDALYRILVRTDQNTRTVMTVQNNDAGAAAQSQLRLDNGTSNTLVSQSGTGFTALGAIATGDGFVLTSAAGLALLANNAAGVIKFATGGTTERLRITADGRLHGSALHNNAGAVTGTTNQYIASGTYTPTLTNVANVTAATAKACQWTRVGNVVTVSGSLDVTPTLAALTTIGISLPIASNLTAATQCAGTACALGVSMPGSISGDAANDRAQLDTVAAAGANTVYFTFTYVVL